MFGGIGFLVNGNMACGVHGQDLIVRLGTADYEAALKKPHVKVFDMTGRPMSGWIVRGEARLPVQRSPSALDRDIHQVREILAAKVG